LRFGDQVEHMQATREAIRSKIGVVDRFPADCVQSVTGLQPLTGLSPPLTVLVLVVLLDRLEAG
jgi:hypothetical protein